MSQLLHNTYLVIALPLLLFCMSVQSFFLQNVTLSQIKALPRKLYLHLESFIQSKTKSDASSSFDNKLLTNMNLNY